MALSKTESTLNFHADGEVVLNIRNLQMFLGKSEGKKKKVGISENGSRDMIAGNFVTLILSDKLNTRKKQKQYNYC